MRDDPKDKSEPGAPRPATVVETLQLFSHDIRSAMSDVVGGLRLIDVTTLDADTRIQVDRIKAAGDTMAALVDAALMAAAGETLIQSEAPEVDMSDWLVALSGRWSGRASERNSTFELDLQGPLPARLRLPQVTLDRILGNLIGNALNHAHGAPVTLKVSGHKGEGVTMTVCDHGPGYPAAVLDQVSQRGEAPPMGARAGSGLGLRIVAELSRQSGGYLELFNAEAGGGVAVLSLPEEVVGWDSRPGKACVPPDLSGLRLLVAEDNLTNQTILRQLLEKMQADVVFVADGRAALDVLDRERFDLALIDIEMPRLSGLDVMAAVRARDDEVAGMPMVALTAYVLRDNREAIYAAGADGIIGKPISSGGEFGRAILRHAGMAVDLPDAADVIAGNTVDAGLGRKMDAARFAELLEVAGLDGQDELLSRLTEDLSAARAALDGAVAAGDIAEIRAQTHILIAISGAVGAERLHRLAEVLNIAAKRRRMDDLMPLYAPCRADLDDLIAYVAGQPDARAAPIR